MCFPGTNAPLSLRANLHIFTKCLRLCFAAAASDTKNPLIVPEPIQVGDSALCSIPDWQYALRWSMSDGYQAPSMYDCAKDCELDPVCTGATFVEFVKPKTKNNCFLMAWAQPDEPAATPCYSGAANIQERLQPPTHAPKYGWCLQCAFNISSWDMEPERAQ